MFETLLKTYKEGNEIDCGTYLKTNLIYDLITNSAGLTEFTEIFYYDYRKRKSPRQFRNHGSTSGFDERYTIFQTVSRDQYPGEEVEAVIVDVMFQVVTINERKIVILIQLN